MRLILFHKTRAQTADAGRSGVNLLRYALASEPLADVILHGLGGCLSWGSGRNLFSRFCAKRRQPETFYGMPEEWLARLPALEHRDGPRQWYFFAAEPSILSYTEEVAIPSQLICRARRNKAADSWFVISDGRFATRTDGALLERVLAGVEADVVTVNAKPELLGELERVRLTPLGRIAGFRRLYTDSAELALAPADWPHHLFVKTDVLDLALTDSTLPQSFSTFLERCRSNALTVRSINVGGIALDLETEDGLADFCRAVLSEARSSELEVRGPNTIPQNSRLIGKVLLGRNIHIGPEVVVVGPTIISSDVRIEQGAIINSSVIGAGACLSRNQRVQNCVVGGPQYDRQRTSQREAGSSEHVSDSRRDVRLWERDYVPFRTWPRFSYARGLKRVVDVSAAMAVLILFVPLMPFVALAIKLNSPGPVFYGDRRQGLRGREFKCLKFRTMVTGADKIQEKLRVVSQVDGPQFKMTDDPRISTVGRFLRETYIDEIPQFFNVLLGHMSVVGPRPSPKSENTLCPLWRDARLSVRPGITGLWQLHRTRQPMKDFQEWIHYDVEYVRNLSLGMDLWICWQTAKKLFDNFISQF